MIILTEPSSDILQVSLKDAVTTNNSPCVVFWRDVTTTGFTPGRSLANTNGTTDVNAVTTPAASTQRIIDHINLYNADTVSITPTFKMDLGGTEYLLWRGRLGIGQSVTYVDGKGWSFPSLTLSALTNNSDPAGTTSTTGVMAGIGRTFVPQTTGRVLFMVTGQGTNSNGDAGFKFDLRYGTGTVPSNGNALTGTVLGADVASSAPTSGATTTVLTCAIAHHGLIDGAASLTLGTTYWFDIGQYAITAGTATFSNLNISVIEL